MKNVSSQISQQSMSFLLSLEVSLKQFSHYTISGIWEINPSFNNHLFLFHPCTCQPTPTNSKALDQNFPQVMFMVKTRMLKY
jgi:hypothetical protein